MQVRAPSEQLGRRGGAWPREGRERGRRGRGLGRQLCPGPWAARGSAHRGYCPAPLAPEPQSLPGGGRLRASAAGPGDPLEPKVCGAKGSSPASFLGRDGRPRPPVSPDHLGNRCSVHPISPFLLGFAAFLTTRTSIYPPGGRHPRVPDTQGAFRLRTHCRGGRVHPKGEHVTCGDSPTGCRSGCGTGRVTDPPETVGLIHRGRVSVVDSATPPRGAEHKPCQALAILRPVLGPPTTPNSPLTHGDPGHWEGLLPLT